MGEVRINTQSGESSRSSTVFRVTESRAGALLLLLPHLLDSCSPTAEVEGAALADRVFAELEDQDTQAMETAKRDLDAAVMEEEKATIFEGLKASAARLSAAASQLPFYLPPFFFFSGIPSF